MEWPTQGFAKENQLCIPSKSKHLTVCVQLPFGIIPSLYLEIQLYFYIMLQYIMFFLFRLCIWFGALFEGAVHSKPISPESHQCWFGCCCTSTSRKDLSAGGQERSCGSVPCKQVPLANRTTSCPSPALPSVCLCVTNTFLLQPSLCLVFGFLCWKDSMLAMLHMMFYKINNFVFLIKRWLML